MTAKRIYDLQYAIGYVVISIILAVMGLWMLMVCSIYDVRCWITSRTAARVRGKLALRLMHVLDRIVGPYRSTMITFAILAPGWRHDARNYARIRRHVADRR